MKVRLVVAQGSQKGKEIPIKHPQFLIGRDPQCQLRPANPMVSRRHCAILVKDGKVFLRDFGSTNGTIVNGKRVEGQQQLNDDDELKIDPLTFRVRIEVAVPAAKAADQAGAGDGNPEDDEAIAALLLDLQEHGPNPGGLIGSGEVPSGSTVMDMPALPSQDQEATKVDETQTKDSKPKENKASGDTSVAAKALLDKYTRRKRT